MNGKYCELAFSGVHQALDLYHGHAHPQSITIIGKYNWKAGDLINLMLP